MKKIHAMYELYGYGDGFCQECKHLACKVASDKRRYYKCRVYGISSSVATDWTITNRACGFKDRDMEYSQIPVFEWLKKQTKPKQEDALPGQVSLFEIMRENSDG